MIKWGWIFSKKRRLELKSGEIFAVLEREFGDLSHIDSTILAAVLTNNLAKREPAWLNTLRGAVKTEIRRLDSIYEEDLCIIEFFFNNISEFNVLQNMSFLLWRQGQWE
jgi:hypothetical protein